MLKAKSMILGNSKINYYVAPDIKLYSLRDAGFVKSNIGNYDLKRPLYEDSPYETSAELKIKISKDFKRLEITITDKSGLKKLNLYQNKKLSKLIPALNFILQELIERHILVEAKKGN